MSRNAPLPPDVAAVLDAYREGLAAETAPKLRGLYLVGSIALGDYRPGLSDVDFIALTDEDLSPDATDRL